MARSDLNSFKSGSIDKLIGRVEEIARRGGTLAEHPEIRLEVERLLGALGKSDIGSGDIFRVIRVLNDLSTEIKEEDVEQFIKAADEGIEATAVEKDVGDSMVLSRDQLRNLIEEYETYLQRQEGGRAEEVIQRLYQLSQGKVTLVEIREITQKYGKIREEIVETIREGVPDNKTVNSLVEEIGVETLITANLDGEVEEVAAVQAAKIAAEAAVAEIKGGDLTDWRGANEVIGHAIKKLPIEAREDVKQLVADITEKAVVTVKTEQVVSDLADGLLEEIVPGQEVNIAARRLIETQIREMMSDRQRVVGVTAEGKDFAQEVARLTGSGDENRTEIRQAIKTVEGKIENLERSFGQEAAAIAIFRQLELQNQIVDDIRGSEPKITYKDATRYAKAVSSNIPINSIGFRLEEVEAEIGAVTGYKGERRVGPGEAERVRVMAALVKADKGALTNIIKIRGELLAKYGLERIPTSSLRTGAMEEVLGLIAKNRQLGQLVQMAQGASIFYERIGKLPETVATKAFFRLGGEKVVMGVAEKIGGQAVKTFVANSLALIKTYGLKEGARLAFSGIIQGGAKFAATKVGLTGVAAAIGAAGGPPGWVISAALIVIDVGLKLVKKIFSKVKETIKGVLATIGIDISGIDFLSGVKGWLRNNLPGFLGKGAAMLVNVAELGIIGLGAVFAGAMASVGSMAALAAVIVAVVLGGMQIMTVRDISSLVQPLGAGQGAIYSDPKDGGRLPGGVVDGECDLSDKTNSILKQNELYGGYNLPGGCTLRESGCGPTSVSKILTKTNKGQNMTPDRVISEPGSPYASMGCEGSSMINARDSLNMHLPRGSVNYDNSTRSCTKQEIAEWICGGNVVMVLADFYYNDSTGRLVTGGHFTLAVKVANGEVYTDDPFYTSGPAFDGTRQSGKVARIRECLLIKADSIQ